MSKDEIVRGIRDERRRTITFLRGLEPQQFDAPTALPGWRLREVIAHLITTDRASVTGTNLITVMGSMDRLERWNERQVPAWANRPIPNLLLGLERWGRRMLRLSRSVPAPLYRLRTPTIFGRAPLGLLLWSRVYDEWIHRQDMRRALGLPDEDVDLAGPSEFLLTAIVFAVLPHVDASDGSVEVALEGVPVTPWRYDLKTGTGGPATHASTEAAARLSGPAPQLVMAAAGRGSFDQLRQEAALKVEGDQELATRFLAKLRVV